MRKKRTRFEVKKGIQAALEAHRRFDYDYMPMGHTWRMPDANYKYRQPWYERIHTGFWRTLMGIFGPPAIRLLYGARVTGRKNLRVLKKQGVITVCNHFNYLDTLFVRDAIGHFRSFHTMGPWNNKGGVGGCIMRHAGMWPFSADLTATKNLMREMERRLKEGKRINFYAEHSMWGNYQKPRPMKIGAFHFAVRFSVPVVPVFCTFDRSKRKGYIRKLRIHILPAIFPDETLPKGQRAEKMKEEAETAWRLCYEEAYKIPLVYLEKPKKEA